MRVNHVTILLLQLPQYKSARNCGKIVQKMGGTKSVKLKKGGGVIFAKKRSSRTAPKPFKFVLHLLEVLGKFPFASIAIAVSLVKYSIKLTQLLIAKTKRYSKKIRRSLQSLGYTLTQLKKPSLFILCAILIAVCFNLLYTNVFKDLPRVEDLVTRKVSLTTKIYDRNGNLLYKIYKDQNRTPIKLDSLPHWAIDAIVATEDKNFYSHNGIYFPSIVRAFFSNLTSLSFQGGSTITQQLVKNALLTPERTLRRKVKEIILSLLTERKFSKNQILEMYLNEVGFGGSIYGIEEAARFYFDKSAADITLPESAYLAGLPASPSLYSSMSNDPQLGKRRQEEVLHQMLEGRFVTQDEYIAAINAPLRITTTKFDIQAPHFVMYVRDYLNRKYGEDMVERGGLEVVTSLDLKIQNQVQQTVTSDVKELNRLHITNGAALVTSPLTGQIIAMVGSTDYFDLKNQGNFNVATSLRQPGSAIKPITYSLALENGYTPTSIIDDSPATFISPGSPAYTPRNYDNKFHGRVTLRTALASSYNIPAVKTLASMGVNKMVERGKNMGITTWNEPNRYGLSITLGGAETKMTDLAVAYATLANLGKRVPLHSILKVTDHNQKILESFSLDKENHPQIVKPEVAFQLIDILSDNSARTPAFGSHSTLAITGKTVAVKTGTSNNLRDNWTFGFTPDYLVATWVGNNNNSPMSYVASGITGASSIWQKIMYSLIRDLPDHTFTPPANIIKAEICASTGNLSCPECPTKREEYFIAGTQPLIRCSAQQFAATPTSPTP